MMNWPQILVILGNFVRCFLRLEHFECVANVERVERAERVERVEYSEHFVNSVSVGNVPLLFGQRSMHLILVHSDPGRKYPQNHNYRELLLPMILAVFDLFPILRLAWSNGSMSGFELVTKPQSFQHNDPVKQHSLL